MRAISNARAVHFAATALLVLSLGVGCASETKTVKRETIRYPSVSEQSASGQNTSGPVVEQRTTETTETKKESGGVISSGVNFIGEVIAFPFRLIDVAFGALF